MLNRDYQTEILGIFLKEPKYFSKTVVTAEMLTGQYQYYFKVAEKVARSNTNIDYSTLMMEMTKYKDIALDFIVELITNTLETYEKYFRSLEVLVIEHYQDRKLDEMHREFIGGKIAREKYVKMINDLMLLKPVETHTYNGDMIRNRRKENNKLLQFSNFKINKIANIKEHDLVLLAGRTGKGKTGYALNLLNDLSRNYPCLYINIELSEDTIIQRLEAMNTGIPMQELNNELLLEQYKIDLIDTYADEVDMNENDVEIITGSKTINQVKSLVGNFNQDKHYIVFVDHIGRIKGQGKDLYERTTNNVIELRNLCLDFNCTIIALCQCNRGEKNVQPSLNMLRDSGELEQSARKVLFIWDDSKDNEPDDYKVYIMKNDSGECDIALPIYYDKPIQKITEKF